MEKSFYIDQRCYWFLLLIPVEEGSSLVSHNDPCGIFIFSVTIVYYRIFVFGMRIATFLGDCMVGEESEKGDHLGILGERPFNCEI